MLNSHGSLKKPFPVLDAAGEGGAGSSGIGKDWKTKNKIYNSRNFKYLLNQIPETGQPQIYNSRNFKYLLNGHQ